MKKINLLYLAIFPLCFLWFQMNDEVSSTSAFFYGFAENKETELSHDRDVKIEKILVTPGQEVKKGQLLMQVKQSTINFKIENVSHDIERLSILAQQQKENLRNRIAQLKAKKQTKIASLNAEIKNLESTIQYQQNLLKDLKSIDSENIITEDTPNAIRLKTLQEQLQTEVEPIDVEVTQLEKELAAIQTPARAQQKKLKNEMEFYKNEQQKLEILAPSDGLIGNILCKEGENISAFSTLINFYERNPTIVKGFVHESLILQVKKEDSLTVVSSLHPSQQVSGQVIGLGSRIVEIPERLRKIPDFKTYGREILIRIPSENPFLQKEKVMLNTLGDKAPNSINTMISFFYKKNKKEEKAIRAAVVSQK